MNYPLSPAASARLAFRSGGTTTQDWGEGGSTPNVSGTIQNGR